MMGNVPEAQMLYTTISKNHFVSINQSTFSFLLGVVVATSACS